MTFRELVQKYQAFDPTTGGFTATRSLREYARLMRVSPMLLSRFYNGLVMNSPTLLAAFLRTFPVAGTDVLAALASDRLECFEEASHVA